MALRAKLEKKNAQEEMRRLMADRKKIKNVIKIDNPLAKYTKTGDLMCILCSSIVKSEHVWKVHINSKQHRENVENAKKLKELTNNFTAKPKHKISSEESIDLPPQKKLKGILKNALDSTVDKPQINTFQHSIEHNEEVKRTDISITLNNRIPEFKNEDKNKSETQTTSDQQAEASDQLLPEGFFDDPILDAKIRNIEYKDPIEEEWEKFQKEIKEEASASAEIIAGEQEEATAERQIDEIDEQIRIWSRVLDLELKKEETKTNQQKAEHFNDNNEEDEDYSSDGSNIDEFLDWRAKKSFT